jgi:hypothetical protein
MIFQPINRAAFAQAKAAHPLQQKIDGYFKTLSATTRVELRGLKSQFDSLRNQTEQIAFLKKKVDQVHGSGAAEKAIETERIRGRSLTMKDTIAVLLSKLTDAPAPSKVVTPAQQTAAPGAAASGTSKAAGRQIIPATIAGTGTVPTVRATAKTTRDRLAQVFNTQFENRQSPAQPTNQTVTAKPRLPRLGQIFNAQLEKQK